MQGWKLFKHAVRMVVGNWREVLRIFLVPSIIGIVFTVGLFLGLSSMIDPRLNHSNDAVFPVGLGVLCFVVLYAGIFAWCVVAWHRFVLLEEHPQGWLPRFHSDRILSYCWQVLKLTLVFLVVLIPVGFLVVFLLQASLVIGLLVGIPVYLLLIVFCIRLGPTLPAAAIGRPITLNDALEKTKGHAGTLIVLFLSIIGFQMLLQLPVFLTAIFVPIVSGVLSLCASVLASLLNISVLTTLHGCFIEGRSID
ncbi:hypothetical protein HGD87_02620 [Rhodobacteraceae bacterium R_SAG9]|nr:hypothetical protein [Rhodobacteraceae bacterium R_SAG9]